jgi:Arc/MetJ-type ribon-helix-helix transcriptional regulator
METEKVCVNLPAVELGKIDLLVAQGLFSSRTDLIRSGIRDVLQQHSELAMSIVSGWSPRIGYQLLSKAELEGAKKSKTRLQLVVVGVLKIGNGVTPALAEETIERIRIFGSVRGPRPVIKRLGSRIVRGLE